MSRPDTPVAVIPPQGPPAPLVVSIPHSGVWIPDDELGAYAVDGRRLLRDGDLHVDRLYADAARLGATTVVTAVSRFVVDLNRFEDDVAGSAVDGATARRQPGYYGDRGIIWGVTTSGERIYRSPLPVELVARRIDAYWRPYHTALRAEVERTVRLFGICILLDAHSMPSRAARLHPDRGNRRADVVPGDCFGQSCAPWLTEETVGFWTGSGHSVQLNVPYSGGAISRTYGRPGEGVHAIQLELNRALYMNERSLEPSDTFNDLREHCAHFVQLLARLGASRAPLR